MLEIRPVLFINGVLLVILAVAMAIPIAIDLGNDGTEWRAFLLGLTVTGFVGLALIFAARPERRQRLRTREAFLATAAGWILCAVFGAIPLYRGGLHLALVDAIFETVSGITTTGATVITGLDAAPRAVLIWRALLNWLGGVGVIVSAMAILPILRIGGMQLFRLEPTTRGADDVAPRISQLAVRILAAYVIFTAALALAFGFAGMTALEAACHAMSTLSTGGFSTSDQSLGHFSEGARWVCLVGMIMGGATFSLYVSPWRRGDRAILRDSQIRWYLVILVFFGLVLTIWNWGRGAMDLGDALRHSLFDAVSVLTTSGFHFGDYSDWGGFAQVAFFIMSFVGGCTGSAAGGIKVFRFEVLFATAGVHLRRLLHPHGILMIDFNRRRVPEAVVRSVLSFVMLYFISAAFLALALTMTPLDLLSSLSAAAAAIGNVGPGLGSMIGPAGSYHAVPVAAKWLLSAGMLLGRLELATLLVLFHPAFWKD